MTDIVGKLWGFCHTLRHDGIDPASELLSHIKSERELKGKTRNTREN